MKWIAIAILGFSLVAAGQNAKVIQLSPEEATQAKSLRDQQDAIAKKISEFDQAIRLKYLTAPKNDEGHTQTYYFGDKYVWVKNGWGSGSFQYSDDFRFIVPSSVPYAPPLNTCQSIFCAVTLTPANGSTFIAN